MYKVLIADDEPVVLKGLRHIIEWGNYDLEIIGEASCGTEAIDIIEKTKVHILITDIKMPYMDGLELINYIIANNLDIRCIILSGYDDFKLVKEAVKLGIENYLLKPVSETELAMTLENAVKKIESSLYRQIEARQGSSILKSNILNRWMTNNISKTELSERAMLLNIDLKTNKYYAAVIKPLDNVASVSGFGSDEKSLLIFAILNVVEQVISENSQGIAFQDMDGDIVILFSNTTGQQDKYISEKVLPQCIKNIKDFLKVDVFVTVGSVETSFERVYNSYSCAKSLQEYRIINPQKNLVKNDEVFLDEANSQNQLTFDYDELKNCIIQKRKDAALDWIDGSYRRLSKTPGLKPSTIRNLSIEVLFTVLNAMKSLGINTNLLEENTDLYTTVSKLVSIDQLSSWLKKKVEEYINFLLSDGSNAGNLLNRVLAYTQTNYYKDINLKIIASEFTNNPAYLGQLFKKEMGESFTNYLNRIRVERAKEFIVNSSLKANEISEKVGYYNVNYFYTVFKKLTGLSFAEFKDLSGKA